MSIKINQIMVPAKEYPVISEDTYIHTAAEILVEKYKGKDASWHGYEALLVNNRFNETVGFLTLHSILKTINLNEKGKEIQVKKLLRPLNSLFVNLNNSVEKVIQVIMKNSINSVPVVEQEKLVGVIRVIDLLWFIDELL